MNYRTSLNYGIAALLGLCVLGSVAQAQQPRSPIERRQQPNGGFWQKQSSVARSFNNASPTRGFNNRSAIVRNGQPNVNAQSIARGPVFRGTVVSNGPVVSNGAVVRQSPVNRVVQANPVNVVVQPNSITRAEQPVMVNPAPVYRVGSENHSVRAR